MKIIFSKLSLCVVLLTWAGAALHADTFGTGGNTFDIDFVEIGNPGNPVDSGTTGNYFSSYGSVSTAYRIGTPFLSRPLAGRPRVRRSMPLSEHIKRALTQQGD